MMAEHRDEEEIQLIGGRLVDIDFVMTNLTGIPDEKFTPLGDEWEDDFQILPDDVGGSPAPPVPPGVPTTSKSV